MLKTITLQIAYVPLVIKDRFGEMAAESKLRLRADFLMKMMAAYEVVQRYPGMIGEMEDTLKREPYSG